MINDALRTSDAGAGVQDLADVAETNGRSTRNRRDVVAFELRIGRDGAESLGLPFVVDSRGFRLFDAGIDRRIGRIDAVDRIGDVLTVADSGKGGERRCSHGH